MFQEIPGKKIIFIQFFEYFQKFEGVFEISVIIRGAHIHACIK